MPTPSRDPSAPDSGIDGVDADEVTAFLALIRG